MKTAYHLLIRNIILSIFIFLPLITQFIVSSKLILFVLIVLYVWLFTNIFLILQKWSIFIALPGLFFSALITPYLILTKKTISYSVIGSILDTDLQESIEFAMSSFFIKTIFIFTIIILAPLVVNILSKRFHQTIQFKSALNIFISLLFLFILTSYIQSTERKTFAIKSGLNAYYPIHELLIIKRVLWDNHYYMKQYKNQKINSKITVDKTNDISVVLVIGEASRKTSYGIYGNKYLTTPYLTKTQDTTPSKILAFDDMVSIAPFTRVAVPSLLSVSNAASYISFIGTTPSIYKILKYTNIKTTFISKKLTKGFHDALASEIIKDNENIINAKTKYDEGLVKKLNENLLQQNKQLITLHLAGSHYRYKNKYPIDKTCFTPNTHEANYLNSIHYTDFILSEIIKRIDNENKPFILIYMPDHGEYVNDNGDNIYGHGFKDLTYNEISIPLIFLFNDSFIKNHKTVINQLRKHLHKSISLDNVSHTILGILGVDAIGFYDKTYDLSSNEFKVHNSVIIDRNLNIDDIQNINFVPITNRNLNIVNICKDNKPE